MTVVNQTINLTVDMGPVHEITSRLAAMSPEILTRLVGAGEVLFVIESSDAGREIVVRARPTDFLRGFIVGANLRIAA